MAEKEKKDKYEELACEFENEDECEEDLDEEGIDIEDAEKKHFGESDEEGI